ncbi:MAG: M14 family metallopeptidase [Candidatus Paceibacterota bacterium]|jgi:predicted deacylase
MTKIFPRWVVITIIAVVALGLGFSVVALLQKQPTPAPNPVAQKVEKANPERKVIGKSVEGRDIEAFTYRSNLTPDPSPKERGGISISPSLSGRGPGGEVLLFVGGIHGGYEWNSVVLAYDLMDYLVANPDAIPANVHVTVIPNANPDGVFKVIGKEGRFTIADVPATGDQSIGRLNADGVDLNRNFNCKWSPKGVWKGKSVGTGTGPFSEPEAMALRNYILENKPNVAVFYHSQANAVYASQCEKGILPETTNIMNTYAKASGYKAVPTFDSYAVTGASEDWLASQNIPAITVELSSHKKVEWEKNLLGITAIIDYYRR